MSTKSLRSSYKRLAIFTISIFLATIPLVSGADSGQAIVKQSDQIKFEQIAPFVQMGGAWGDRASGKHGTFGEFPGGASSPAHTHSGAYHGVVISGVMINPFGDEQNPPHMGPGSYWYVPANAEHITACVSEEPCLFYFHAEGAFDFTPVGQ